MSASNPLPPPPPNPRRLPPPCWSHDEAIALIDAYRDKWYTLRRGNLKANHWQEVADAVAHQCPNASPSKTAVQCRHKMEKLRKRYRTEIQRARSMPVSRFSSSWLHFKRMDAMEKGPQAKPDYKSNSDGDEDDNEDDYDTSGGQGFYMVENGNPMNNSMRMMNSRSIQKIYRNGTASPANVNLSPNPASGFRIRIPTGVSITQAGGNPNISGGGGNFGVGSSSREEGGKKRERDGMEEMVSAIKVMGEGFVRMEQMKMEMAREIERMRMVMEMKRTQMIVESQQRIVEAFAFADKRKKQPSPASQMQ